MNILMLNPPFLEKYSREQRSPAVTKSGTFYYPMWLSYATGTLEENGFNVKLIDAPAEGIELQKILDYVKKFNPALAVIVTSTPSVESDVQIVDQLKAVAPNCYTIMVGPHASACDEETLKLSGNLNAIARGEYDYIVRDVARAIQSGNDPNLTKGLTFQRDGQIIRNEDAEIIKDLDALPFVTKVYKKHLNYKTYFYSGNRYPIVTFITSRGCPHHCVFCVYPQTFSKRYRHRSPEDVVEEMEYIKDAFPDLGEIMFEDDTFALDQKRCRKICELIIDRKLNITWSANSRVDVDLETLKMMKSAGCRSLLVGFESGNQQILNNMKKGITLDQSREFMENARTAGILINGAFLVGSIGETRETMRETLEFAKELNPDVAQFFPIMVYPGTEAYEWAKSNGYLTTKKYSDWLTSAGLHNCVVRRPNLTEKDLVEYCDLMRKEFYLRPSYILYKLKQSILHPSEGRRTFLSFMRFAKHLFLGTDLEKQVSELPKHAQD